MEKLIVELDDGRRVVIKYDPKKQRLIVGGAKSLYSSIETIAEKFGIDTDPVFHTYGRMKYLKRIPRKRYRETLSILQEAYTIHAVRSHGRLI